MNNKSSLEICDLMFGSSLYEINHLFFELFSEIFSEIWLWVENEYLAEICRVEKEIWP